MPSSSESEDDELLKEALAPGFTMEAVKKQTWVDKPAAVATKSLRVIDDGAEEHFSFQGISITPQQRKFIANKLEEYLDKQVKESDLLSKAWEGKVLMTDNKKKGIRLMATSKKRIKDKGPVEEEQQQFPVKPPKQKKRKIDEDSDNLSTMEKFQAAAVSPEWVLEGKGVFGKGCTRGEVITGAVHSWAKDKKKQ